MILSYRTLHDTQDITACRAHLKFLNIKGAYLCKIPIFEVFSASLNSDHFVHLSKSIWNSQHPMSNFSDPHTGLLPRQDYAVHCQTSRAPDYYGLGIRVGIYFAWMQAYITNNFLASEIASTSDTNTIFLLVVLIAMIKCSSIKMLEQVDGLILMHLSGGFLFGIFSLWGCRTRRYMDDGPKAIRFFGGFGTHSRLIVSLAVSIYGQWYWAYGVHGGYLVGK
jgi:hypothetical protein